jgi:hypothetical protein
LNAGDSQTSLRQKQAQHIKTESGGSGAQPDIKEEEDEDYNHSESHNSYREVEI